MNKQDQTIPASQTTQPTHTHDCMCCTFLGGAVVAHKLTDFYLCGETVIARQSGEPADNRTILVSFVWQWHCGDQNHIWRKACDMLNQRR